MEPGRQRDMREQVAAAVQANVSSALVAGLSLALFGFFMFSIPEVKDTFTLGDAIFNYTLRIGGAAMLLAAAACLTGRPAALVFDAVMSTLVGIGLIVSSVLMIYGAGGAGINQILYLLFGGMFISAGVRNGRLYGSVSAVPLTETTRDRSSTRTEVPAAPPVHGGTSSLAERLRDARRGTQDHPPTAAAVERNTAAGVDGGAKLAKGTQGSAHSKPAPTESPPSVSHGPRSEPPQVAPREQEAENSEPITEGFLASFAKKPPERD